MAPTGTEPTECMSVANGRSHITYMFPNRTIPYDPTLPCFAITIKPMSRSKVYYQHDLQLFITKHIWPYYDILHTVFEMDSKNVLHAHMIANGGPNIFNHRKIRYWSQDIQQLSPEDVPRWVSYIQKDVKNIDTQEQVLWKHIASTECLFD